MRASEERGVGEVGREGEVEGEVSQLRAQVLQLTREKEHLQAQRRGQATSQETEREQTSAGEVVRENEALRQQVQTD